MRRGFVVFLNALGSLVLSASAALSNNTHRIANEASNAKGDETGGLMWEGVQVTAKNHVLLHHTSGFVPNGCLCGILGPSGSGKSTLLNALSGTYQAASHLLEGQVSCYSVVDDDKGRTIELYPVTSGSIAFLQQRDDFFGMLTARETLRLASFLELPDLTSGQRDDLILSRVQALGLADHLDRRVGDSFSVGSSPRLSGGERRRLSVALELLTHKQLLVADEPTSGLDSSRAFKVVQSLRETVQNQNIPGLMVIHQPRSSVWHNGLLDYVMLMAPGGRVCYCGPREEALQFVASKGYHCPPATNPAEFLVDLVSIDSEDEDLSREDRERIEELANGFAEYQHQKLHASSSNKRLSVQERNIELNKATERLLRINPFRLTRRFAALLRRSWRQTSRNWVIHIFRASASIGNAILLAQIFPSVRLGEEPKANSVADRVALLSFGAINMCFMAFLKTITLIADEKPVVQREQSRKQYSSLEYLAAKVIVELPIDSAFSGVFTATLKMCSGVCISWVRVTMVFSLLTAAGSTLGLLLGSWLPTGKLATTASTPVLVILMVVGIINPSGVDQKAAPTPKVIQLLKRVSPFAYAIEALCLGEYPGMKFGRRDWRNLPRMGALSMVRNGEQVLEALGLANKNFDDITKSLGKLSLGFLALSWFGMFVQNRRRPHRRYTKETESRGSMGPSLTFGRKTHANRLRV